MTSSGEILDAAYAGDLTALSLLQLLCGFSLDEAAAYCGVSPHTFRRWRRDREPSLASVRLLAVRAGYLPWPEWIGWEVHHGLLFAPGMTRGGFSPGEVLALPYLHALAAEQRRELAEVRGERLSASRSDDLTPALARTMGRR